MRQPVQVHGHGEQARVPELAPGAAAQEPPQLVLQILDTDVKAQPLLVVPRPQRAGRS